MIERLNRGDPGTLGDILLGVLTWILIAAVLIGMLICGG